MRVFVLNMRGQPLTPCSPGKARILKKRQSKSSKARAIYNLLKYLIGETKQPICLDIDAGSKH